MSKIRSEIKRVPKTEADCMNAVNGEAIFPSLIHGKAIGEHTPWIHSPRMYINGKISAVLTGDSEINLKINNGMFSCRESISETADRSKNERIKRKIQLSAALETIFESHINEKK